ADGTLVEDDSMQLGSFHNTTAHGEWTLSQSDGLPDRAGTTRYKGTFLWLGQNFLSSNKLDNAVRPRFVTYFDPTHPDRMIGFLQAYMFSPFPPGFATAGIVNVLPANPADPLASNHIPGTTIPPPGGLDPIPTLPTGCSIPPAGNCLGTYHFFIRRIKPQ